MKKSPIDPELLHLLVSVYNQSIQTYFYFPEVIICGQHRLEREAFNRLVEHEFVQPYGADSFGRYYRLSKKGEDFLFQSLFRRRHRPSVSVIPVGQHRLPFIEGCELL